jgi:hypothetical protein
LFDKSLFHILKGKFAGLPRKISVRKVFFMCTNVNGELEYTSRPQQQKLFNDDRPGVYRPVFGSSLQRVQIESSDSTDSSLAESFLPGSLLHQIAMAG